MRNQEDASPVGVAAWRPIETAPKDGTWVLAWADYWGMPWPVRWRFNHRVGHAYFTGSDELDDYTNPEGNYLDPTHWMPLASPPTGPVSDRPTSNTEDHK